ncbi:Conserved membrane protein YqhR [Gracilibacillus ureilyticus]|uniref:Conserved membrane protein YqhR n=1 Tax=Gracilibacillus ureilyticus TaxID=531814 RepID=A0A1H9LYD8_9BACI|nr:YqhR family membrane protein [Gracilibacillus ureilyticus]SER16329.1 Conserved membrane protein YqhR [Gracilibacillus ureilyticus]
MRYRRKNKGPIGQVMIPKVISIGFFGGLIWSLVASITAYFNFTAVSPKTFVLRSWLQTSWTDQWLGQLISILVLSLLSILLALLYYITLKKVQGIWVGVIIGFVLWFLIFWLFEPIFPNIPVFYMLDSDTIVTTICLLIIYSVFISYSISFAYDQQLKDDNTG